MEYDQCLFQRLPAIGAFPEADGQVAGITYSTEHNRLYCIHRITVIKVFCNTDDFGRAFIIYKLARDGEGESQHLDGGFIQNNLIHTVGGVFFEKTSFHQLHFHQFTHTGHNAIFVDGVFSFLILQQADALAAATSAEKMMRTAYRLYFGHGKQFLLHGIVTFQKRIIQRNTDDVFGIISDGNLFQVSGLPVDNHNKRYQHNGDDGLKNHYGNGEPALREPEPLSEDIERTEAAQVKRRIRSRTNHGHDEKPHRT